MVKKKNEPAQEQLQISLERITIREILTQSCALDTQWGELSKNQQETFVRRMERNCFEVVIEDCIANGIDRYFTDARFRQRYSACTNRIISNIEMSANSDESIVKRIIIGALDTYKIAVYTSYELFPSASQRERDNLALRLQQKIPDKVSREHTCFKCFDNRTIFHDYQSRTADEASTKSIKCVNCGYVWRR
jgi:DNA-directed RNA polymerase subunit M/transcription elongation factor TFIIS